MPALIGELNGALECRGERRRRLEATAYDLDDPPSLEAFLGAKGKRTGVAISRLGTSAAVACGAYWYAIERLDSGPRPR
jgi:hypothetical protein